MRNLALLTGLLLAAPVALQARGDKVIPHVPDGGGYRTILVFNNISPAIAINNMRLQFFHQNGNPWVVATNRGTGSEIVLDLGGFQTLRIETLGQSNPVTSGYAVVRDDQPENSTFSVDYALGITVFYEVKSGATVVDTVSVPIGQPTAAWIFPVENDDTTGVYTGFAIVNLSGNANPITITLREATSPSSGQVTNSTQAQLTLDPFEQRVEFLHERVFEGKTTLRGLAEGTSDGPVAFLALLETKVDPVRRQYATMVPAYRDALRTNSYIQLPQPLVGSAAIPLDADIPQADYFRESQELEAYPWDLIYETQSATARRFQAQNGARFARLGVLDLDSFDGLSLPGLRARQDIVETTIDLSNGSPNIVVDFAFAIRTDQGRYAKARIVDIGEATDVQTGIIYYHLTLEVYVYR